MSTTLVDTTDLAEAEAVTSEAYTRVTLGSRSGLTGTRIRITRSVLGPCTSDAIALSFHMSFEIPQMDDILLMRINSGAYYARQVPDDAVVARRGETLAVGAHAGIPLLGGMDHANFACLPVDRALLSRVAANRPAGDDEPVRLTGQGAVSPQMGRYFAGVVDHVCATIEHHEDQTPNPLIVGTVQTYLATAMLVTFPHTALLEPSIEDRHDSTPVLLRRAVAFIDDNAHRDISVIDIAAAVYVTPRAVQYMFRRHLDCTPTEYLRKVRLQYAHHDLVVGNQATTTVGATCRKWGFSHMGRFAVAYRLAYGRSPYVTLRS